MVFFFFFLFFVNKSFVKCVKKEPSWWSKYNVHLVNLIQLPQLLSLTLQNATYLVGHVMTIGSDYNEVCKIHVTHHPISNSLTLFWMVYMFLLWTSHKFIVKTQHNHKDCMTFDIPSSILINDITSNTGPHEYVRMTTYLVNGSPYCGWTLLVLRWPLEIATVSCSVGQRSNLAKLVYTINDHEL